MVTTHNIQSGDVSRRSTVFSPVSQQSRRFPFGNDVRQVFSAIHVYLWLHGIGFTNRMKWSRKNSISAFFSLVFLTIDGICFAYILCIDVIYVSDPSVGYNKGALTNILLAVANAAIRVLFYTRRKRLKHVEYRLAQIRAQVGNVSDIRSKRMSLGRFAALIRAFLITNDLYMYIYLACYFATDRTHFSYAYTNAYLPPTYTIPLFYMTRILKPLVFIHSATTAYFCSVCYILKSTLLKFNQNIHHGQDQLKSLEKTYRDIIDVILHVDRFFHPFLVASFTSILCNVFQQAYYSIFASSNQFLHQLLVNAIWLFVQFISMCLSSGSVLNASAEIRATAIACSLDSSKSRSMQFIVQLNESFGGFRLLNSVVIDAGLVLTTLGSLVTYGILIATFSTSSSAASTSSSVVYNRTLPSGIN